MSASHYSFNANLKAYLKFKNLRVKLKKNYILLFMEQNFIRKYKSEKTWNLFNILFKLWKQSARRCSVRKGVVRNLARPATLLKKRFWHRCFPVNFAKFLGTISTSSDCSSLHITINSSLKSILCDFADILILRDIKNLSNSCFSSL